MIEVSDFIVPIASGAFAFGGAIFGNRKDIAWLKRWLERHDEDITTLHSRISSIKNQ